MYKEISKTEAKLSEIEVLWNERKDRIINHESDFSEATGTVYYVSENGDDANSGLSATEAWKTLEKLRNVEIKEGDAVLFERGGIYRGKLTGAKGVVYSAYGVGDKPRIYGCEYNGNNSEDWILYSENNQIKIWKFKRRLMDVGIIVFDNGKVYGYKYIPSYVDGKFVCRDEKTKEFKVEEDINKNLGFVSFADDVKNDKGYPDTDRAMGELYLRCDEGNPASVFSSIEFGEKRNIAYYDECNTFDNLCFKYCGAHGIGCGTTKNLIVRNCVFEWIGGSVQFYTNDGDVVRYGNGIEIYGGCDNFQVTNCYINQCYDAGATFQYQFNDNDVVIKNVKFENNIIENCVYSVEYFLGAAVSNETIRYGENILIDNNIMRLAGMGHGSTRPDGHSQAHIKGWDHISNRFENFVISNNIFDRSMWSLIHLGTEDKKYLPLFQCNTYIQGLNNKLFKIRSGENIEFIENKQNAEDYIETILGDKKCEFYCSEQIAYYCYPFVEDNSIK